MRPLPPRDTKGIEVEPYGGAAPAAHRGTEAQTMKYSRLMLFEN